MKYIHSAKNPQVKNWKKLLTRKEREKTGTFLVVGFHLVEEALKAGQVVELIIREGTDIPVSWNYGAIPVTSVSGEVAAALADTETPQGVFAVCKIPRYPKAPEGKRFLLIDSVQDPGNLGTMIRTADAAGVDAVIVGTGSVDVYNGKVLRSAQGSHFHLPVIKGERFEWIKIFKEHQIPVYGTALENGAEYKSVSPSPSFVLIVGNEGSGVNKDLLMATDKNLYIPIRGRSESLNVAVAAGILLYYLSE